MAKLTGPFMSLDASGTLGDILTASHWKGRNYMRQRVIPANPRSGAQKAVRAILGTITKACRAVLAEHFPGTPIGSTFFIEARDIAPSGQSWISNLVKILYGVDATVQSQWDALSPTVQGYFDTNAATIGLTDYSNSNTGASASAGRQLFALAYFYVNYETNDVFGDFPGTITNVEVESFLNVVHLPAA